MSAYNWTATAAVSSSVLPSTVVCCSENVPIEPDYYRSDCYRHSRFEMASKEDLKVSDQSHIDCETVRTTQTSVDQRQMASEAT